MRFIGALLLCLLGLGLLVSFSFGIAGPTAPDGLPWQYQEAIIIGVVVELFGGLASLIAGLYIGVKNPYKVRIPYEPYTD